MAVSSSRIIISRNLIRLSKTPNTQSPPLQFLTYRNQSSSRFNTNFNHKDQILESDSLDLNHITSVKRIELAMHQILVKKCSPGWLPFVPGGSYWVPPIGSIKSNSVAKMVEKLASSLKKEDMDARNGDRLVKTERGWPSNAYFFNGASQHWIEMEINSNNKSQSEEEE